MSAFVHAQGMKIVHAGRGVKKGQNFVLKRRVNKKGTRLNENRPKFICFDKHTNLGT